MSSHIHIPETINLYYCRECRAVLVKVPWLEPDGHWSFRMLPLEELSGASSHD